MTNELSAEFRSLNEQDFLNLSSEELAKLTTEQATEGLSQGDIFWRVCDYAQYPESYWKERARINSASTGNSTTSGNQITFAGRIALLSDQERSAIRQREIEEASKREAAALEVARTREWIFKTIEELSDNQLVRVLSGIDAFCGLESIDRMDWIRGRLDKFTPENFTRLLSIDDPEGCGVPGLPLIVLIGHLHNDETVKWLLDKIEHLKDDQKTELLSVPCALGNLIIKGEYARTRVIQTIDKLSTAQLAKIFEPRYGASSDIEGYVSDEWLNEIEDRVSAYLDGKTSDAPPAPSGS
jgi:hypothetical protein